MPPRSSGRRAPARSSAPPASVSDELRAKVLAVHARLCAEYRCPIGYFHDLDPLSELISSLLSHRTKNADSGRAFKQLRRAFPTWAAVRDAPVEAVREAIRPATWPELKAPRIQATLREIASRLGGAATSGETARDDPLSDDALDFLGALPVHEARDWLESITGVGPKTSAAVLSFSRLRIPALPVDSHHHRVAVRLGLIPEHVDVGPAHAWLEAQLPPDWDAQQVYDNHEVLMLHGQRVCFWRDPACARCVVLDLCPTGQARLDVAPTNAEPGRAEAAGTPLAPEQRPAPDARGVLAFDFDAADAAGAAPMPVHPHPGAGPAPERGDHNPDGAQESAAGASAAGTGHMPGPGDGDTGGASAFAHGTHGKGDSREVLNDEKAVDSGDRESSRRGGAGPDDAPDPAKFAKQLDGRMGGAGWGSESVGGSAVDRRHDEKKD
ncbi:hypothetical protein tb265_08330 [Gemmatimonadetes bacterium T265]|nr:hypothetical protein tb265_08330 [Gemmatimonadetes bacterium T265]